MKRLFLNLLIYLVITLKLFFQMPYTQMAFSQISVTQKPDSQIQDSSLISQSISQISNSQSVSPISVYGVVLAGGSGKRLWPISRKENPKQFVPFINNKTLLDETIERNLDLTSSKKLWIVLTQDYADKVRELNSSTIEQIVVEPLAKNTGPAILLSVLKIYNENPNSIVFFVPADHYIPNKDLYSHSLSKAIEYAKNSEDIVLLGIQPRNPSSDYGYIEYGDLKDDNEIYSVTCFHEKPSHELAKNYVEAGNYLWNAGIFCAKAKVFIEHFKNLCPEMFINIEKYLESKKIDFYQNLAEIPFDRAVLEKTNKCAVMPSHFHWSDVGSIEQFLLARKSLDTENQNKPIEVDAINNLINSNKMVVILGLDNLCVVDTPDILFVTLRHETERIREVLKYLEKQGRDQYL